MTSLLKKLSTSIKIHVAKRLRSLFGQFTNCRPNPSAVVVSLNCEVCTRRRRRRDLPRQLSRVGVGGVYWALTVNLLCDNFRWCSVVTANESDVVTSCPLVLKKWSTSQSLELGQH